MIEVIDDQGLFDVIGIILPAAISFFLAMVVKFSFSKKAICLKVLTLLSNLRQIASNYCGLIKKAELYVCDIMWPNNLWSCIWIFTFILGWIESWNENISYYFRCDFINNLAPLWVEMSAHQLFENQWWTKYFRLL